MAKEVAAPGTSLTLGGGVETEEAMAMNGVC